MQESVGRGPRRNAGMHAYTGIADRSRRRNRAVVVGGGFIGLEMVKTSVTLDSKSRW